MVITQYIFNLRDKKVPDNIGAKAKNLSFLLQTNLVIFNATFTNARIKFCTPDNRRSVLIAIVKGMLNPAVSNEWDAYDYLFMLGTPKILDEIKDKRHKAQSAVIQKRLERAKKSVEDGLKERHIILDSAQLSHPLDGLQSPVMRGIQQDTRNIDATEATMIRISKTLAAALLMAMSIITMVECSPAGSPLDGTQWKLIGWTLSSLSPTAFKITVNFANGQISGNSGVNTYGGPYKSGPGDAFLVGPLASTEMAGPETAMRAEGAYMTLLVQAKSYKIADGKLTLYDNGGNELLIFEAASK